MTSSRAISLSLHGALEALAAPAVMAAPFALGLGVEATIIAVALGAILMGHALSIFGQRPLIPLGAHAEFDYLLAIMALGAGLGVGLTTGEEAATIFLVGVGAAQIALTAGTRFSASRGV